MASRFTYYAERYGLLPDTQFGGRPGRTTEQALLILNEAITTAWKHSKVVSLIAFDLKGAFNGVDKTALDRCLSAKGIPNQARKWVQSFMSDRSACVKFDGYTSTLSNILFPGLPQGSPLSPILFIYFNGDLVDQPVDIKGGASAFIDDYFRWRVGNTAEENIQTLQEIDIPRIEKWAQCTGSRFAAGKTELIHFTKKKTEQSNATTIIMNNREIKPSQSVKLLGVICDQELRWRAHVQRTVKRATVASLAINRLRYLRPAQMRQLYQACVVPKMDYASTVWHNPSKNRWQITALSTVQRSALIRILSSFKTAATQALEVESSLLPTHLRLLKRAQRTMTNLLTLPQTHPIADSIKRAIRSKAPAQERRDIRSQVRKTVRTLELDQLEDMETIGTCPLPPWEDPPFGLIQINTDQTTAKDQVLLATRHPHTVMYTDASARKGLLGAAVIMMDSMDNVCTAWSINVGPDWKWTIHAAELIAVYYAIELAMRVQRSASTQQPTTYTIFSDSKKALQAISHPSRKSGYHIVQSITRIAHEAQRLLQVTIRLIWIPSHSGIKGNEEADRVAKASVSETSSHGFQRLASLQRKTIRRETLKKWKQEWDTSTKSQHLRKIDAATPGPHTRKLYDHLPRHRASLLTQLRIGHSWLNSFRKRIGRSDHDKCDCGAVETMVHVFIDCPLLRELRSKLRQKIGDRFNSLATMLGGRPPDDNRKSRNATMEELNAVLDFAEQSGRFRNRETRYEAQRMT
jgi:ribonuclease HI